jgi:hypothetical protein
VKAESSATMSRQAEELWQEDAWFSEQGKATRAHEEHKVKGFTPSLEKQ